MNVDVACEWVPALQLLHTSGEVTAAHTVSGQARWRLLTISSAACQALSVEQPDRPYS